MAIAGSVAEAFFGIPQSLIDVAKLYLDDDLLRFAENIGKVLKNNQFKHREYRLKNEP